MSDNPTIPPAGDPNPGTPAPEPSVNLTATSVIALTNSILGLVGVVNPGLAGATLAVKGALTLVNSTLVPQIAALVRSGDITPEVQATVKATYDQYRASFAAAFDAPEWRVEP